MGISKRDSFHILSYNITDSACSQETKCACPAWGIIEIVKKYIYIALIIFFLLIINGLAHSIYDLWSKKDLITAAQKKLTEEKLRNRKLKGELSYVQTKEFIEQQARDSLFLSKPNEKEIIIPIASKSAEKQETNKSNLQKWLDLFL